MKADPSSVPWRTLIQRGDMARFHQARALGCFPPRHALLDLLEETASLIQGRGLSERLTQRLVLWVDLLAPHADLTTPRLAAAMARLQSPPVLAALRRAGLPPAIEYYIISWE